MSKSSVEEAQIKLKALMEKAQREKLDLRQLKAIKKRGIAEFKLQRKYKISLIVFLVAVVYGNVQHLFNTDKCVIASTKALEKVFRAPDDCNFCRNIKSPVRVSNINPDDFERKYAYNGNVVIVTDATSNWTATEVFDFHYFKELYEKDDPQMKTLDCQFFPYKSGLKNLFQAFKMDKDRVDYKAGSQPWYFGWSNCNEQIAAKLRKHYNRPYFLPKTSELNVVDWIFMGGRGLGAHMHLDNVRLPSWQAQLKGTKEWLLAPPPECIFQCKFFSVVVNPGDIIILDTNKWFHKTEVLSDDLSITIGAEYD